MNNVYLVGGLTPRTDLDNYQTAFLSKEKAEESKAYWNSFHADNNYDEYHIDSIEIDDMAEHDSELLDRCSMTFKSIIHNRHGQISSETEKELFADINTFIAELKAEVGE